MWYTIGMYLFRSGIVSDYILSPILPEDVRAVAQLEALLEQEGIQRDGNLDYTVGLYDQDYKLVATGSCFGNTLRCMAVDSRHQGEGLMNQVVSELIQFQYQRGNTHLFLYTKCDKAPIFRDLGFHEIARVEGRVVFMENKSNGFSSYLHKLEQQTADSGLIGTVHGAVVMNANPFTLGHQYLVEQAASQCDVLHLFIVSEDVSLVPLKVREQLVRAGCAHLYNVVFHQTGSYMISNATFPSYFLKDEDLVITSHAGLDIAVFVKIAKALNITCRFVGEEPFSHVTSIYNEVMAKGLPEAGISCTVLPRREAEGGAISASAVRVLLKEGNFESLRSLVPESTLDYFTSPEAQPVLDRIRRSSGVIHY